LSTLTTPLSEADYARLELLLTRASADSMSLEQMDGFFCALVCGPSEEPMSDYFADVVGEELDEESLRFTLVDPDELSALLIRHWNRIASAMLEGRPYLPVLLEDDDGEMHGHDWARGFFEGMEFDREEWDELVTHKEHWQVMAPITVLLADSGHEAVPALKKRIELQEELIKVVVLIPLCLAGIFDFFHGNDA
jgi:uncharacterized protein